MNSERTLSANGALSARQSEVARLVAAGRSTREIAEALALSPRTIETHIALIFNKLGVRSRTELTAAILLGPTGVDAGNVPSARIELIGRDADIRAIATLVAEHRFVTVLGTGGVGKTKTSLRVASDATDRFTDGVWFLELGTLRTGEYIAPALAQLLGITLAAETGVLASLIRQIKNKRALIVFDSCEHLVRDVGTTVSAILRDCGDIRILATSRESIGISGERTYRLPPLTVPESGRALTRDDLPNYSAVALFAQRARAADPGFALTDDTIAVVGELCRRLDGIPLAIELAAARSNIFTPMQLMERIEDRFAILHDGKRDVAPRHQNMRALIDWSYDQLDEAERRLFRRLSVFSGSFVFEAAVAMVDRPKSQEYDVVATLGSLIDKSLVVVDAEPVHRRYRFLESTRLYAREKLQESQEGDAVSLLHLRYLRDTFVALRARAKRDFSLELQTAFATDIADIRAALDAALPRGDVRVAAELLAAIGSHWRFVGLDREGIARNETFITAMYGSDPLMIARLSTTFSEMLYKSGRLQRACEAAERALRFARESRDAPCLAAAIVAMTMTLGPSELPRALELITEAEALPAMSIASEYTLRERRAWFTMYGGDYDACDRLSRRLIAENRALGDRYEEASILYSLSFNEYRRGNPQAAAALAVEAIDLLRSFGNVSGFATICKLGAAYFCALGDAQSARAAAGEALAIYAAIDPESANVALVLEVLAFALALRGDLPRAARLQAFAGIALGRHGYRYTFVETDVHDGLTAILRANLTAAHRASLEEDGALLSAAAALSLAT